MKPLFTSAVTEADKVRIQLELDMFEPINVFDACERMNLTVRFVNINMEGMYINSKDKPNPQILISSLRPLPRRAFTCAHELGHHVFNHGTKTDMLSKDDPYSASDDIEELLVNVFAGNLLMPIAGISAELAVRNWSAKTLTPLQAYTLSSFFGTGYQSFIFHCRVNHLITSAQEKELLKQTPSKILKTLINNSGPAIPFKIIDGLSEISTVDVEATNYVFLPPRTKVLGNHLKKLGGIAIGDAYVAIKPGVVQVVTADETFSCFVRIQRPAYMGLAEYRHLEEEND